MLFTPEMSRRARVIELWAAIKYLGKEGIDDLVYGLHERTRQFAEELRLKDFHILNEVVFNQILICGDDNAITDMMLRLIQESGTCWCSGSVWMDRKVIRISVCSWATTAEDIHHSVSAFEKARAQARIILATTRKSEAWL